MTDHERTCLALAAMLMHEDFVCRLVVFDVEPLAAAIVWC